MANISPIFKKRGDKKSEENYRPGLSNISKIFEQWMFHQISSFLDYYLAKQQCGFRKGCSAQYCLLVMLERKKKAVGKGKRFGALLTDLSKTLDCLSHELLIRKLHAYGFTYQLKNFSKVAYQTDNKRPKLTRRRAHGRKFYLEYHKGLIFSCLTCFG